MGVCINAIPTRHGLLGRLKDHLWGMCAIRLHQWCWGAGLSAVLSLPSKAAQPQAPQHELRFAACWTLVDQREVAAAGTCATGALAAADRSAEAMALRGALSLLQGDHGTAEASALEALRVFDPVRDPWGVAAWIQRTLGHVRYDRGDYAAALGHYRELLALAMRYDPANEHLLGRAHYNIGNQFWGMDQRDSCKAHYHEALAHWSHGDNSRNPVIGYLHEVLGTYAWEEKNEALALEHFNMAASRQVKTTATDRADTLMVSAGSEAGRGRAAEALRLCERAIDFRVKNYGPAHPNTACMHTDLARMLVSLARPEEAMARAQVAITLLLPGFAPVDVWENPADVDAATNHRHLLDALLVKFGSLERRAGDARADRSADEVIDRALACIEHLRTGARMEGSKLFWTTQVRGFLEAALAHSHRRAANDPSAIGRALAIMELGRNALLAEAIRSLDAATSAGLPDTLAAEERRLRSRIAEMSRYLLLEEKKCARMDADRAGLWRRSIAADQAALDRLVLRLAAEHPDYHQLKYGASTVDRSRISARLGADRSLLSMFQGESALYFLLLDADGAELVKEDAPADVIAAARWLRGFLADRERSLEDPPGSRARFIASARAVYAAMFGRFARALRGHLVVLPDGDFHHLPFEVLLTADPSTESDYRTLPYLIRQCVIAYTPTVGALLRNEGPRSQGGYLGMAAAYSGARAPMLRNTINEVESAQALLGGTIFTGAAATEAAFKANAERATVLHLAMHTALDDLDPMNSALDFGVNDSSEDGRLNLYELHGMRLVARLAVLGACRTGDGRLLNGEGIMSTARGFAYAGCPSTVMGLWDLEDAATASIIRGFFERVNEGATLDEALRDAKLDMLDRSDPLKAHPAYWSALVLMGDERPIDLSIPWYRRAWIWIAAGCALLLMVSRSRILQRIKDR